MKADHQNLAALRLLFQRPAGERTVAHQCEVPGCSTIVLSAHFCWHHRHLAEDTGAQHTDRGEG